MSIEIQPQTDEVLTKSELAEFLDVSERTIERWIVERTIPFIVLPHKGQRCSVRFLKSTVVVSFSRTPVLLNFYPFS